MTSQNPSTSIASNPFRIERTPFISRPDTPFSPTPSTPQPISSPAPPPPSSGGGSGRSRQVILTPEEYELQRREIAESGRVADTSIAPIPTGRSQQVVLDRQDRMTLSGQATLSRAEYDLQRSQIAESGRVADTSLFPISRQRSTQQVITQEVLPADTLRREETRVITPEERRRTALSNVQQQQTAFEDRYREVTGGSLFVRQPSDSKTVRTLRAVGDVGYTTTIGFPVMISAGIRAGSNIAEQTQTRFFGRTEEERDQARFFQRGEQTDQFFSSIAPFTPPTDEQTGRLAQVERLRDLEFNPEGAVGLGTAVGGATFAAASIRGRTTPPFQGVRTADVRITPAGETSITATRPGLFGRQRTQVDVTVEPSGRTTLVESVRGREVARRITESQEATRVVGDIRLTGESAGVRPTDATLTFFQRAVDIEIPTGPRTQLRGTVRGETTQVTRVTEPTLTQRGVDFGTQIELVRPDLTGTLRSRSTVGDSVRDFFTNPLGKRGEVQLGGRDFSLSRPDATSRGIDTSPFGSQRTSFLDMPSIRVPDLSLLQQTGRLQTPFLVRGETRLSSLPSDIGAGSLPQGAFSIDWSNPFGREQIEFISRPSDIDDAGTTGQNIVDAPAIPSTDSLNISPSDQLMAPTQFFNPGVVNANWQLPRGVSPLPFAPIIPLPLPRLPGGGGVRGGRLGRGQSRSTSATQTIFQRLFGVESSPNGKGRGSEQTGLTLR